jgi:AraC-like DNA-binding protein
MLVYNTYTLFIIYKYQHDIEFQTSASVKQKLNWLFLITYGITLNSLASFIMNSLTQFTTMNWEYVIFLIFINIFFFKAIIHPDQFLGIDEKKLSPINLDRDKSTEYFQRIEEIIHSNELFLDPDLSLHNVAQAVKFSDRIVSQTIKQNVAMNFADYINIKRINYAKDILRTTTKSEKNVLEILYEAGFNSKSVFNTQFKKHTGQSPTDFRNSNNPKIQAI